MRALILGCLLLVSACVTKPSEPTTTVSDVMAACGTTTQTPAAKFRCVGQRLRSDPDWQRDPHPDLVAVLASTADVQAEQLQAGRITDAEATLRFREAQSRALTEAERRDTANATAAPRRRSTYCYRLGDGFMCN